MTREDKAQLTLANQWFRHSNRVKNILIARRWLRNGLLPPYPPIYQEPWPRRPTEEPLRDERLAPPLYFHARRKV